MVVDSNNQSLKRERKTQSLYKLYNSTLCRFSISLSLFLNFSKDGLKLGSSFQHFVIKLYLKGRQKKVYTETARPIFNEQGF